MNSIRNLIADDSFAMSFQSMGQYRTALLKALDVTPPAPEVGELVAALKEPGAFPEYRTITSEQADRAATLLRQQQHLLGLACAELDRLGAFSAAPAPAPAVAPVAEDLQHLIRFMCRTWVAIDEWASMFSEAMDTYPMIQGTRNQMNLREIAAQSYDIRRVAFGVQLMLPHNAIPLPQAGEGEA
jgi:hypothetical protein